MIGEDDLPQDDYPRMTSFREHTQKLYVKNVWCSRREREATKNRQQVASWWERWCQYYSPGWASLNSMSIPMRMPKWKWQTL